MPSIEKKIIRFTQYFVYWTARLILRCLCKIKVDTALLQTIQAPLIAANHQSYMDPFFCIAALPFWYVRGYLLPIKFMTANQYFFGPLLPLLYIFGCYPAGKNKYISSGTSGAASQLKRGMSTLIFPEGQRVSAGRVPGKYGIIKILQATETGLLLCRIRSTEKRGLRRGLKFSYESVDTAKFDSPDQILDRIYSLD
jgi:1-acyl-sn-glycerol-3-phosphate acyltransferase